MALALLALAALSQAPSAPIMPVRSSATASVRIVQGAAVRFGRAADHGPMRLTKALVRAEGGQHRPAFLVEFQ